MGYFSSGAEGMDYHAEWCSRCVHDDDPRGCEVWNAHMLKNYDECNKPDSVLHLLIPRTARGLGNERCRMFYEKPISGDRKSTRRR